MTPPPEPQVVWLPRTTGWEAWTQGTGGWQPETVQDHSTGPALVALPVQALVSLPLRVQSTDPEVVRGLVRVHLEGRGILVPGNPEEAITFWSVDTGSAPPQIHAVALLESRISGPGPLPAAARRFEPSPLLRRASEDGALLWMECGRWQALFNRGLKPAYFQTLSSDDFGEDLLAELRCLSEALQINGLIKEPRVVEVEAAPGEIPPTLPAEALGVPLVRRSPAPPVIPETAGGIVPAAVAETWRRRRNLRLSLSAVAGGFAAYLIWIAFSWIQLGTGEARLDQLRRETSASAPLVARIEAARTLSEQLRPATDYRSYPLEQLHLIVDLLPEEGVRLTYFEVEEDKLILRGEASSSAAAVAWRGRLLGSDAFRDYTWDFPQPEILPDNRATFVAEGALPEPFP